MPKESFWLQPGPASRCAKAAVVWGVLAALLLTLALFVLVSVGGVSWCNQLGLVAPPVLTAALALIYGVSYRAHRARQSRGE